MFRDVEVLVIVGDSGWILPECGRPRKHLPRSWRFSRKFRIGSKLSWRSAGRENHHFPRLFTGTFQQAIGRTKHSPLPPGEYAVRVMAKQGHGGARFVVSAESQLRVKSF